MKLPDMQSYKTTPFYTYVLQEVKGNIARKPQPQRKDRQYISILLALMQEASLSMRNLERATDLILRQLTRKTWMDRSESQLYLEKLVQILIKCSSFKLRKRCHKIIELLIAKNLDLLTEPGTILFEMLRSQSEIEDILKIFLPVINACSNRSIQVSSQWKAKILEMISKKAVPAFLRGYNRNQNPENLYLIVKIYSKICAFKSTFSNTRNYFATEILLPFVFQAALATHPEYDQPQFVVCAEKNSNLFFYSHAKKWANKALGMLFSVYHNPHYRQYAIMQAKIEHESIWRTWKEQWIQPYLNKIIFSMARIDPKPIQHEKFAILSKLIYQYSSITDQYIDILMKQILPSFIVLSKDEINLIQKNQAVEHVNNTRNINLEKPIQLWTNLFENILLKKRDAERVSGIIEFVLEKISSSGLDEVFVGLKLFGIILNYSRKLENDSLGILQNIIDGQFSQLLRSRSVVIQNVAFVILYFLVQNEKEDSKIRLSGLLQPCYEGIVRQPGHIRLLAAFSLTFLTNLWLRDRPSFKVDVQALIIILMEVIGLYHYNFLKISQFLIQLCVTEAQISTYLLKLIELYNISKEKILLKVILQILYKKNGLTKKEEDFIMDMLNKQSFLFYKKQNRLIQLLKRNLLFNIRIQLVKNMTVISQHHVAFYLKMTENWLFCQDNKIQLIQIQSIENMKYIFLMRYFEKATKLMESKQLKNNLMEPFFLMLNRFYIDCNFVQMLYDWYCTLLLLSILLSQSQNSDALLVYQSNIQEIICLSILKGKKLKRMKENVLIQRSIMELILAYLKCFKSTQLHPNKMSEIRGYFIEGIIFYRKELTLSQVFDVILILNSLLKSQIFLITTSRKNNVRVTKLIFSLLLQIGETQNQANIPKVTNSYRYERDDNSVLKNVLEQIRVNKGIEAANFNDFESCPVLIELKQEIVDIKERKSDNLRSAVKRFKKKTPLIEKMFNFTLF